MTQSTKRCSTCREVLPLTEFYRRSTNPDGLQYGCRSCSRAAGRAFKERNPEYGREYMRTYPLAKRAHHTRKYKYGISADEYTEMLNKQDGKCAICRTVMEKPCVDHCHTTGKVRGLLCAPCNLGIGHMMDDPERLRAAAVYLSS